MCLSLTNRVDRGTDRRKRERKRKNDEERERDRARETHIEHTTEREI